MQLCSVIVFLLLSSGMSANGTIVYFESNSTINNTIIKDFFLENSQTNNSGNYSNLMAPATPGVITGIAAQCPNVTLQTYSVAAVPGALSYTWTVPTGWVITAGAGTTSISVTTGTTGQNGNITVRAVDGSGSSGARNLAVNVGSATPATPGVISGMTTQCPSVAAQIYSVVAVSNATSYLWSVPSGWIITAGATTRTITATTGVTGSNGNITVSAVNSCGTSAAQTLAVSVSPAKPLVPNATTGTTASCSGFTANWDAATNATSYRLDVSTVNTFASFVAGYNNLVIGNVTTADVSGLTAGRTYYYRVRAVNSCGTSTSSNVVSFATLPATPTIPVSISGTIAQCPNLSNQIYSTATVANATFYTWAVPTGWTITSGLGTNTITVTTGAFGQNGNITVAAANSCGTSANRTLAVTVKVGVPNIPTANAGSNAACTSFRANWSAAAGATAYYLDVATDSGFTSFVSGYNNKNVGNFTNATVTGLTAGTTYYYRVLAASSCDVSPYSSTITYATLSVPNVPAATVSTLPNCTTTSVNWSIGTGATSYRLDVATDVAFTAFVPTYNNANVGNVLTRSVTGLTAGTTYYYRVLAVNTCGNSAYSNTISFVTNPRPNAPTATAGTAITCSSITANWSAVAGATSYRLDVSKVSDFSTFVAGNNNRNVGVVTAINVTGLTPATTYYYRVLAVNACGNSIYSNTISAITNPSPTPPTSKAGTTAACASFRANWNLVAGATNYRLDVSKVSDFSTFVSGYNNRSVGNVNNSTVTTLTPGTTYYYRVLATYPCGNSAYSATITYATLPLPVAPVSNAGTTATCTGFKANWATVAGATSYRLDVATDAAFTAFVSGYNSRNVGNVLTLVVAGLNPNTTYYYRVAAANTCGVGGYSSTKTYATLPLPIAPTANSVTSVNCTGVTASWNTIAGATSYSLDVSLNPGFTSFVPTYNNLNVGNVLTKNITGLTAGTTYYYRVLATNGCGNSVYSSTIIFQTNPVPDVSVANAGTAATCTSFDANWSAATGATKYFLDVATDAGFASFVPGYNNKDMGSATTLTISGLTVGTQYYYRVLANNSCGNSAYSATILSETLPLPSVPVLNADTPACTSIAASWSPSTTAVSYAIDVAKDAAFTSYVSGYNNKDVGNATSISITGLLPGTTYYYRVLASNGCGDSNYSVAKTTNTLPTVVTPTTTAYTDPGATANCTSFIANWTPVADATTYYLDVATESGFTAFVPGYNNKDVGNGATFSVTGLVVERTYYYRVRASNSCTTSASSNTEIGQTATATVTAAAVANASSNPTCTTMTANWASYAGATNYILDVSTLNDFSTYVPGYNKLIVGNVTNYVISGLTAGTTYYYRVRASDDCGKSANSNIITCATLPPVAFTGTGVNLPDTSTCSSITINWSPVQDATTYFIDVATDVAFATPLAGYNNLNTGNVQTLTINTLSEATDYFYRIRASNGCGTSADIFTDKVTTKVSPIAPTSPTASTLTCTGATANWDADPNTIGYFLDVSKDSNFTTFVGGYNNKSIGNFTALNITGLAAGTTYYYRVLSSNSCGESAYSATVSFDTAPLPTVPVATAGTNIGCDVITANWDASTNVTSYYIDVAIDAGFTSFVVGYNYLSVGNVNNVVVTGLTPGNNYHYRVLASNSCGESAYSAPITTATKALPLAPMIKDGTNALCTEFTANWEAVSDATSYRIDVATDSNFTDYVVNYNNANTGNTTSMVISGLKANTVYYYRVLAVNGCWSVNYSATATYTTAPLPAAPLANSGSNPTCSGFTANWNSSANANVYYLDVARDEVFIDYVQGYNNLNVLGVTAKGIIGLTPGTTYYYRVLSSNACGESVYSLTETYTTTPVPDVPVANAGTTINCSSFSANWEVATGANTYAIDVATDAGFTDYVLGYNNLDTGNATITNIVGLTPGTTYYYRVLASNTCGESAY
jgi:phosphodiesterase/alkaline phosphatase D-like protein